MNDSAKDVEHLIEQLARVMSPRLFDNGRPDDEVGPGTRGAREDLRRHARAVLDSGLVVSAAEQKRLVIGPGLYRNRLGAEVCVERLYATTDSIGGIWLAWQGGGVLGRRDLLVTREGLEESGYERVAGHCEGMS